MADDLGEEKLALPRRRKPLGEHAGAHWKAGLQLLLSLVVFIFCRARRSGVACGAQLVAGVVQHRRAAHPDGRASIILLV
eukprot:7004395-Prymnesium_polylepis.1